MSRTGSIVSGAAVALTLAFAPSAEAASVESFRANASRDGVRYQIVVCAPVGAQVVFTTRLAGPGGRKYVIPPRSGRQAHACPTWRYTVSERFAPGRYTTQVVVRVDDERLVTPRATVVVPK